MTCPHFKVLLQVCNNLGPVWNSWGSPSFTSPNSISLLHLHVYTTQWMVGKWFCISKSSAFRLRSCEEKMVIAFWRFLRTNNFNSNAVLKRTAKDVCVALVDAGFSLAADTADRLTSTETGLHPASHAVTCLRWRRCALDARFETWETEEWPHVDLQEESVCKMHWPDTSPCMFLFCFLYLDFFCFVLPELVSQNFFPQRGLIDETFSFLKKNGQIFLHCINATGDDFILGPCLFCSAYAFLFVFSHPFFFHS